MVKHAHDTFGSADIVVCNAAIRPHQSFLDISLEDWTGRADEPVSCFYIARSVLPLMTERKWGVYQHLRMDGYTGQTNRAHNVAAKQASMRLRRRSATSLARSA